MGKGATEWEDILIEKGIIQAPPSPPRQQEIVYGVADDHQEDDLDDEDFFKSYRQRRLEELDFQEIGRADFVREVTESSKTRYVIVLLNGPGEASEVMTRECRELASRERQLKFVQILGTRCIEHYPDGLCPTILVYHGGEVYTRITNCTPVQLRTIVKTILLELTGTSQAEANDSSSD